MGVGASDLSVGFLMQYYGGVSVIVVMKKIITYFFVMLTVSMMLGSCSRKGVHMPKHRKRTHCNCPTFTEVVPELSMDSIKIDLKV